MSSTVTGIASTTARAGLCEWDPVNDEPGALVVDWGTVATTGSGVFLTFSNGTAVASLTKGQFYATMFICGGGASGPTFYYIPFVPIGVPTMTEGSTIQNIASIFDAGEGAQRTGGFNSPPSVAAALSAETAVNLNGQRAYVYFSTVVPTP